MSASPTSYKRAIERPDPGDLAIYYLDGEITMLILYAFDLLELDGEDLREKPL